MREPITQRQFVSKGLLFLLSWMVVALGQSAWVEWLCPVAASVGYALLFYSLQECPARHLVWVAGLWFASAEWVHLSWMTSIAYQGTYILFVQGVLALFLGLQFALFSRFIPSSWLGILAWSGGWTILEWSRLYVLCGFSWNPVGMALAAYLPSLQIASLAGGYGLSFWVMIANLYVFQVMKRRGTGWRGALILCVFPYILGLYLLQATSGSTEESLSVGLVQTGLLPSQKVLLPGREGEWISAHEQWMRMCRDLQEKQTKWDLLVFPEATVPFQLDSMIYSYADVERSLTDVFGPSISTSFPSRQYPFAMKEYVSNAFWAQTIANFYGAEVVMGLDYRESLTSKNYNSAFCFGKELKRYDKQILLPLAEYLPFSWLKKWTQSYGIVDFFSRGKGARLLGSQHPLAVSICYEETFSYIMREARLLGASLFVNLSNDGYYPNSRLAKQHLYHARVRAAENGIPLLRSCNTGITAVIDPWGRILADLGEGDAVHGVLGCRLQIEERRTPYLLWGDGGILCLSFGFIVIYFFLEMTRFLLKKKSLG